MPQRLSLKASASLLGLAAGAVGWSGLAQAASEETNSQMMLLPEHYELLENGVVVFKLETGENLSLTPDQYLILEDGLLLITDELAQASVYSLPVMGSVRAQLLTDLEQVATIDGTVAEATPAQSLAITEGQAPRLSEQVQLQSYEVAQASGDTSNTNAVGDALATSMAVAPGAMALLGMLMTSDQPEPPEFLSNAMFQALTPTNARAFTGSAGDSFIGYSSASISAPDALVDAGRGAGNSATFDMTAGGNNLLLVGNSAAAFSGSINYTGGELADSLTFGSDLAKQRGTVTLNAGGGDNTLVAANSAGAAGSISYIGGNLTDNFSFGDNLGLKGSVTLTAGDGDNELIAGRLAARDTFLGAAAGVSYIGGSGKDDLTFGDGAAYSGTINVDLGTDAIADKVTFGGSIARGGTFTIQNFNFNHDLIDIPSTVNDDSSEFSFSGGDIKWEDYGMSHTIIFQGLGTGASGVTTTIAQLASVIV